MKDSFYIDIEKLNDTIETLSSVENCINNVDLIDNFKDLESYFNSINLEHNNCINNYKIYINQIETNINKVRKMINNLCDNLRVVVDEYGNIEEVSKKDLNKLSTNFRNIYKEKFRKKIETSLGEVTLLEGGYNSYQDNNNLTVIPTPDPTQVETTNQQSSFNTVPIGIAIGAAGIAGAIGAVVIEEKYGKVRRRKPEIIEDYRYRDDLEAADYGYTNDEIEFGKYGKKSNMQNGPYHASRSEREADRYYGNDTNNRY